MYFAGIRDSITRRLQHFERRAGLWFPVSRFQYHVSASIIRNAVETREFQLKDEHVRLCDLLKLAGIAGSGGQGKHMVADGAVTVDGRPESRKTAKIRAGQTVECQGVKVVVLAKAQA
jgi:ribosome-associated protein